MRWQKSGSFGFAKRWLVCRAKPNVPLVRWLKLFLKNVRWEKIKIQKCWLLDRLSDGSFVPLLYVYFCRSFLLCRLLGLQVTFRQLCEGWEIEALKLNLVQMLDRSTNVEFCTSPQLLQNCSLAVRCLCF